MTQRRGGETDFNVITERLKDEIFELRMERDLTRKRLAAVFKENRRLRKQIWSRRTVEVPSLPLLGVVR